MARRNFIKAYNDMVSGLGQSGVSGLNTPERVNNGPFLREVDAMARPSSTNLPNKDKSYPSRYIVNRPKSVYKPSPTTNAQDVGGWGGIKPKNTRGNVFVDIDGEPFADEVDNEGIEVVDTSHKIQGHLSLVDLTRPYVPREPNKNPGETHETEKMTNNEERTITRTLPKGFSDSNTPYVLPKFTPTFREMISTKSKKDTLVSLTEPTPPSMQKWAIEWNSEPKHSISIAELKEDIIREKSERSVPGNERTKDIIFAEEGTPFDDKSAQRKQQPMEYKLTERTPNAMKPRNNAHYYSNSDFETDFESDSTFFEPSNYEQGLKQKEAKRPGLLNNKTALDWLPEKYESMKRVFKGIPKEKYSFKQAIQQKKKDGKQQPISSPFLGTSDREFSHDEERRQFHQWFRNRLSRKGEKDESADSRKNQFFGIDENSDNPFYAIGSDPYTTAGRRGNMKSITYSEGDPTRSPPKNPSQNTEMNTELDRQARSTSNAPDHLPPKQEVNETVGLEKNSSFYYWLKQRGLINLTKSKTSEMSKPLQTDNVVTTEPKFPWSTSYMCKYVPGGSPNQKDRNSSKKIPKPVRSNLSREKIPLRKAAMQAFSKMRTVRNKVNSQGALKKIEIAKTNSSRGKSSDKKNRQNADANNGRKDLQPERIPYHEWIVGNELDHVKNLRLMENNHAAPKMMNLKKLFPSLHEQRSTSPVNYWESTFSKPLPRTKDDEFYSREKGTVLRDTATKYCDTPNVSRSSSKIKQHAKLPNLFVDHNDFIDISEDPISMLKSLLDEPTDPIGFTSSSRTDGEDSKISRCAVKLSQKIGKNHAGGPTLIAAKAPKDSTIHLQLARQTDGKTQGGLETVANSSSKLGNKFSIRGLEAGRNEMDEDWLKMINPKGFNFDCEADLIQHLKKSSSECKSSLAIDKQT